MVYKHVLHLYISKINSKILDAAPKCYITLQTIYILFWFGFLVFLVFLLEDHFAQQGKCGEMLFVLFLLRRMTSPYRHYFCARKKTRASVPSSWQQQCKFYSSLFKNCTQQIKKCIGSIIMVFPTLFDDIKCLTSPDLMLGDTLAFARNCQIK